MKPAYSVAAFFFVATLGAPPIHGQVQGNLMAQEKADVPFRPITIVGIPIASHSGIYVDYEDEDLTTVSNTQDMTAHTLIEMTGITGVASTSGGSVVGNTSGINSVTLAAFKAANGGYYGAYTVPADVSRGTMAGAIDTRVQIDEMAAALMVRRPAITYIVSPDDPLLAVKFNYMVAVDGVNADGTTNTPNGILDVSEIIAMRSDAFVEYCYAANGLAIVGPDVNFPSGLAQLQALAAAGNLLPNNQRAAMRPSQVDHPVVKVFDDKGTDITGKPTNPASVSFTVSDNLSGPGRVEVYPGVTPNPPGSLDLLMQANPGLIGAVYFDGINRTFTSVDGLPALAGPFTEGVYTIRAIDQSGNDTSVIFSVKANNTFPLVSIINDYDFLFDRLHGTALTIPTTRSSTSSVIIHDDVGVGSVILPGIPTVISPAGATLATLPPGTTDVLVVITGLVPGEYPFSVANAGGKVTQGSWRVENLALAVNTAAAVYDQAADGFSGIINIKVNSTAGAEKIVQYDPATQTKIDVKANGGFPIAVLATRPSANVINYFSLRDTEGNSAFQKLDIGQYNYPPNSGGGADYGQIEIAGSGSVTAASSFPDDTNPGQRGAFLPGILRVDANDATNSVSLSAGWRAIPGALVIPDNQPNVTYSLSANGQVLAFGAMSPNPGSSGTGVSYIPTIISVTNAVNFTLTVVSNGVHICLDSVPSGTLCLRPAEPFVTARPTVRALAYYMAPPPLGPHIPVYNLGDVQDVSLGNGASLSGFNATSFGTLSKAAFRDGFVEEGNVNLLGDQTYVIEATISAPFYTPTFTLKLTFDSTKRTPGKTVELARMDPCGLTLFNASAPAGGNIATAQVTGFGRYAVVESKFKTTYRADSGRCHFVSGVPGVTATQSSSNSQLDQALNVLGSLGLKSIGTTCKLGPTDTPFTPPGELKICYEPADLAQAGVTDEALTVYQFNEEGVRERLDGLFVDRGRGFATGSVSRFSSQFGAFAPAPSVPARDLLPPITALAVDGRALLAAPSYVITTTSTLSLQAADPTFPGAPVSGLAGTFILIDVPFVDVVTTPGVAYGGPFSLSEGAHILAYYSSDVAGNIEATRVVSVLAIPPPARTGTRAIALGAANQFWTVAREGAAVAIAKTDDNGVAIASASLPQALPDAQWGVLFDGAGAAYAVGTASGASTAGTDLAVYKASPGGDALASSQILDGGLGGNDLIFGVASPGWIAGAVQVSGPSNLEIPGEGVFAAALWRFNPADGTVALSTTFARGAALGVASDADGSAWVAGYVENPAPRSSRIYDLALWHYAADGQILLAGPFRREAYVADFSSTFTAKILLSNGAITVVAPRGRTGAGTDLGSVRFDKATGAVLAESAWRAADASSAYPAALLADGSGTLAAGGLENAATRAALWRYSADGSFAAASLTAAGGIRAAALRGLELWLAVDEATSPYKVTAESALSGSLADIQPPRIELIVGSPSFTDGGGVVFVSSTTPLTFAATDDKLALGDGLGAGATSVHYRRDSNGAFTAFLSSFSFTVEGAHSTDFYGVDAADNPGPILSRSLTVDRTPPVTLSAQNGAVITLAASDPNGAGVARIRYLVDYGNPDVCNGVAENTNAAPGTCENPWYAGPFTLTAGPHILAFQAFDAVGNAEALQFAYPNGDTLALSSGGMGIGRDPNDALWTVVSENEAIAFAHANSAGALLSSATLQDAVFGFPWSVFFDAAGRSYAIGIADGPATQAADVAIYKASPSGDVVESRTVFDSGYANNDIVLDAKAPGWVVGAAQTAGPVDFDAAGERSFAMALWKFDPALGSVQLSTTYARGSFDIGAGVAVDADGSLWISGYSLRPDAPATFGFDLSLWHYAADGRTPLGGPHLWPGYLSDFDGSITARIYVTNGSVYIAAPRVNAAGGTDTAFLRFDKATSRTTAETVWHAGDGSTSYPVAILPEASGLLVAGGIGSNATQAALWRFGYNGAFQSVATADAGGAQGAVLKGSELWLSVDGSTVPYRVLAEAPVAGLLIDISTPAPTLTSLAITPSTASIEVNATAQFAAAGTFSDGSTRTMTGEVAWRTDALSVTTISASGLATGLEPGTALVIASSGAISALATLTVRTPVLTALAVTPLTASIEVNATAQFEAAGTFSDGSTRTLTGQVQWTTDAPSVTTISASGLAMGLAPGIALVIASSGAVSASATLTVRVPVLTALAVTPSTATVESGATAQFAAAGTFSDGSTRMMTGEVGWRTDALSVAEVDQTGLALGVGGGTAHVIASSDAISGQATLTVTLATPTVSSISPASAENGTNVAAAVVGTGFDRSAALSLERSDALRGTWAPTGSFAQGRYFGTLTKLRDGRALFAGGITGASTIGSTAVDLYNPATGVWTAGPPLKQGRNQYAAVMLADGRVLVSGGYGPGVVVKTAEIYDPEHDTWTLVAQMNSIRTGHQLVLLPNGKVLAAGGHNGSIYQNSAEIYDPIANTWSTAASMANTHSHPAAATLSDGKVMIAGGFGGNATAEVYNHTANAWTSAGSMHIARYLPRAALLPSGKILVSGGSGSGVREAGDVYDPATNTWTATGLMAVPRYIHVMVLVNGTPLVIDGESSSAIASTEIYDAATNAWLPGPPLSAPRTWTSGVTLDDGRVLVAGGLGSVGGATLNTAEILGGAAVSIAATDVSVTDARHLAGIFDLTGAAIGSWDVVVRESVGRIARLNGGFQVLPRAPTLASIAVTPAAASILAGTTAQFAAAGTFTDGSTRTLTGQVAWTTDASTVATVGPTGLALGVGGGTAHVIASSGAISGQATLTVTLPAPTVSSIAPSSATMGTNVSVAVVGTNFDESAALSLERADALRGTWAPTGSFAQGRYFGTLTELRDGRVLFAGGITGASTIGSTAVDLYNPATGVWTAGPPLKQGRNQYAAVMLADGRVLVSGGYGPGVVVKTAEIFDPEHDTWTPVAQMNFIRSGHQLVLLPNGKVLAAGGMDGANYLNSAEIYDPVANMWSTAASMVNGHSHPAAATLNDGKVMIAGGFGNATAEVYNHTANAWTSAGSLHIARYLPRAALLPSGKIIVSGGSGSGVRETGDVYDPATNTWTATGLMAVPRYIHVMVLVNGTPLVIDGESSSAIASTEIYDAATNAWRPGPPLATPRTWTSGVTLDDGRVLVAGGLGSVGGATLNTAEVLGAPAVVIAATDVALTDGQHLSGTLDLIGAATGYWDVVVRESGGRLGRLNGGFQILAPILASITVTPSTASLEVGGTVQFAAAGTFTDGSTRTMTGEVAWMTDAPLVATVTAAGLATGLAPGTALVIASSGAISALATLTVRTPVLTALAVTPSTASILPGTTVQFAAAGTFSDGSTRTLTGEVEWTTDFSTVATVSASGLATAVAGGTAHVIASLGAISGQSTLNVAYVATSTGTVGGSPELTLVSTAPFSVVIVSTEAGAGAVALGSAAGQGMILVSVVYDVTRQDPGATATLTWFFDPALVDAATLAIWRFDGISWSSVTVLNQVVSVAGGVGTVTGDVVRTSLYALFSIDAVAPVTTLLVDGLPAGAASLSLVPTNEIGFAAVDAGVGVRETRYTLDGGAETIFVAPFRLAAGAHTLAYLSVDRAGNQEAARTVAVAVTNPSGDSAPPLVSLDFPGASALGVERAVGGVVSVRGSANDASALTWTLKAGSAVLASGTGNVSGALAAWDTTALSGPQTLTLSAVDAYGNAATTTAQVFVGAPVMTFAIGRKDSDAIVSTLKGPTGIAVRSDGALWVASTENDKILLVSPAGVLLGAAGRAPGHSGDDKESGKKEKKDKDHDDKDRDDRNSDGLSFKSPQGLALDAAEHLYVADRDLNRVVKLSADGQVLLLKIGKSGSGPGELKRPFDVAVDGNGDVYVADSGNRRISVFNASGIFLRQFGQGALPAESEVRGIALTSEGLWVSDKESERIYLFSRAGSLIKSIGGADSVVGEISRTRGLAADRLGALYVIEPNRDRAQKFDPQGKGLLAFGSSAGLSKADKLAKRYLTQPIDAAVAPDGSIWITDTGRDRIVRYALPIPGGYGVVALSAGGGAVSSASIEPALRVVDHTDGATVSRDDGAGVRVPKGALAADLEITVDKGDENQDKEQKTAKRLEMKIKAVSEEVQYGPEGTTFNTPVTLTVPYDANLIAAQGIREDELKVYYWNPGLKDWQAMPSMVDKLNKTVNAQTNHFSAYQVQGPGAGIGVAAAVDEFGLRDQYAFPNPSRNGAPVTFRIQPGLADSIEVRVYDVSGRRIHSSSDFRFSVLDDGNGKGAQNTYDHAWDVSGIGSGVYTYVISATRAGQTPIIKSGKAGVIK